MMNHTKDAVTGQNETPAGAERIIGFAGATIIPVAAPTISAGCMLVRGGRISAIGRDIPLDDAEIVYDCRGLTIAPGLIDCHCHVGIVPEKIDWEYADVNEDTDPATAYVQARDGIDFNDSGFEDALEGGVTSMVIHPGSSNVLGGLDIAVKSAGSTVNGRIIREPAGMKAAWTAAGKHGKEGKYPKTRMGVAAVLRQWLTKTRDYMDEGEAGSSTGVLERMSLDNLSRVLAGEMPIRIHSMTPVDFRSILRLKEEFGFDMTIEHGDEAHLMAEELAREDVPVVYGPFVGDRRFSMWRNTRPDAALILSRAGVTVSLQTDHPVVPIRDLRMQGSLLMRFGGGTPQEIMPMLTINAARIMGLEDRLGSLQVDKDADFAVYTDHPLKVRSRVEAVFVDGDQVYGDELSRSG